MSETQFNQWLDQLVTLRLPLWQQLPEFDLYMDQVITETDHYLHPLGIEPLTKSMVNSYVKRKIIKRPKKKQYTRAHLAEIIIVSLFKTIFPLETIHTGINQARQTLDASQAYDQFVNQINAELASLTQPDSQSLFTADDNIAAITQKAAIRAVLYQLISQHALLLEKKTEPVK
ncbi:DUF1836 domain-containing protein [Loigolactobacillus rennini]|nr:DUF1836 domain-containing protein [Loigolactobacillus rennini]